MKTYLCLLIVGILLAAIPVRAETSIYGGPIQGDWIAGGSPYLIFGDVEVCTGDTLSIGPGVTVQFYGKYWFAVSGLLRATGTATDSIRFTSNPLENPAGWYGLRFFDADEACNLEYCVIERGIADGTELDSGGGVHCAYSSPRFFHCAIRLNMAMSEGGGVFCQSSSPTFNRCVIAHNLASYGGGVSCFDHSSPSFQYCDIENNAAGSGGGVWCDLDVTPEFFGCSLNGNSSSGGGGGVFCRRGGPATSPVFTDCEINSNTTSGTGGGGVYCYNASPSFTGCHIDDNQVISGYGGGVAVFRDTGSSAPVFMSCYLTGNSAGGDGGAMDCDQNCAPQLANCLLHGNSATGNGGGLNCQGVNSAPSLNHCTISDNSAGVQGGNIHCGVNAAPVIISTIISFASGTGIHYSGNQTSQLEYCDLFGNTAGNIANPELGPRQVGQIDYTNNNSDPCDSLYNIFLDPEFVDAGAADYRLGDFSHCLGAARYNGAPSQDIVGAERDSLPPDIGAYENEGRTPFGYLRGHLTMDQLPAGLYRVVDHIHILADDTLRLAAGTILKFTGPYWFSIFGTLLADGTEVAPVSFTANPVANPGRWRGLRFFPGSSASRLTWCRIENGWATGSGSERNGGGVYCEATAPTFLFCTIQDNAADIFGGGVSCTGTPSPAFYDCTLQGNVADGHGGGLFCQNGATPFLSHCVLSGNQGSCGGGIFGLMAYPDLQNDCEIRGNSATGDGGGVGGDGNFDGCLILDNVAAGSGGGVINNEDSNFLNCTITGNTAGLHGGGIFGFSMYTDCFIRDNQASGGGGVAGGGNFEFCEIVGNTASDDGGGVYCTDEASAGFNQCRIDSNTAVNDGGGVYCIERSYPGFVNCTLIDNSAGNDGGGLYCYTGTPTTNNPTFVLCTFSSNAAGAGSGGGVYVKDSRLELNSCIVAFSSGEGIYFVSSAGSSIRYCDIFGNSGGEIGFGLNPMHGPAGIGVISTTNNNGDPADQYLNIYLDPCFEDPGQGDFHLRVPSRCLGAAQPGGPDYDFEGLPRPDPVGSLPDIGAFEGGLYSPLSIVENDPIPQRFALAQNYPNPFNPCTRIEYAVPRPCRVELTVYDTRGRRVATLVDNREQAGFKRVTWNAKQFAAGVYFYRLVAGDFTGEGKMVLLK
ncbi:MAG: T9SS type A sorting domain-containing protein [bacterium]